LSNITCDYISPSGLKIALDNGKATVIDFETSLRYRDGHVPGAWLGIRANLETNLRRVAPGSLLVLTSGDGVIARLAAPEAQRLTSVPVKVLQGGTDAWRSERLPMQEGMSQVADTTDDVWYRPYDRTANVEEAMKDYLTWEVNLVKQIERDDDARFRSFAH